VEKQAGLIASWLQIGFIHGVMNTDNMAISGETIDYGPCAFIDVYDPATVFSSIDQFGRYAYANQPRIAHWNLARLAETLLPLIDADEASSIARATEILQEFPEKFEAFQLAGLRRKLGLHTAEEGDAGLAQNLLNLMQAGKADFTSVFRRLSAPEASQNARELFENPADFDNWWADWRYRVAREPMDEAKRSAVMRQVNPAFIPRNHRVEDALAAAVVEGDFRPFHALFEVLQHPFDDQPGNQRFAEPPPPSETTYRTFCGT
jgi:uncharacterized protein YdiU (UPF0061 family)